MFVTPSCAVDKRRVQSIWRPERWCDTETVARPAPAPAVEPPTPPPPQKARSKWTLPVGLALVVFAPLAGVGGGDLGTVALLAMVGSGMALPGGIILPLWRTASAGAPRAASLATVGGGEGHPMPSIVTRRLCSG